MSGSATLLNFSSALFRFLVRTPPGVISFSNVKGNLSRTGLLDWDVFLAQFHSTRLSVRINKTAQPYRRVNIFLFLDHLKILVVRYNTP